MSEDDRDSLNNFGFQEGLKRLSEEASSTEFAREAFRYDTPLSQLRQMLRDEGADFDSDEETALKKYIFACFSELAYLRRTKYDLPARDRYKVVPSETLDEIKNYDFEINTEMLLRESLEIGVATLDSERGFSYTIFSTPYFVVIAVRGTSALKDWLINLYAGPIKLSEEGYHPGFLNEARRALVPLREVVDRYGLPIYFTGHSLGAAVATILRHQWGEPVAGAKLMTPYVYASPRIGSAEVANRFRTCSIIGPDDIVPRVAPKSFGYVDTDGQEMDKPDAVLVSERKILAKFWMLLKNHSIEKYRSELGRASGVASGDFSPSVYLDALRSRMIDRYRTLGNIQPNN
ncbi:MAG TPA: lipase family protein [Edaphobacter sp.]|nr:lipase family protein [Edaphobacter sp.]